MGRSATAEVEEVQSEMFAELDMDNALHKKILKAAKKHYKLKSARAEALSTAKQEEDASGDELCGLMHEAKLNAFRYDSVEVKLVQTREKAKVKLIVEDPDEEAADDDE